MAVSMLRLLRAPGLDEHPFCELEMTQAPGKIPSYNADGVAPWSECVAAEG